ncbi:MAG: hypothetical protein KJI69_06330, partial [Patescibacteria group bacterium]|nr:hypothetical protein [Patescibacteria group bacterium]
EKIKKGLIKCVSASLDPNYRVKSSNKFVGPTLLHAALVSEPFIKGMTNFVSLSDDFEGRSVIQLEDEQPNFFGLMKSLKESFENIEEKTVTKEDIAEIFAKIHTAEAEGIVKDVEGEEEKEEEADEEKTEEETVEDKTEDKTEETTEEKEEEEEKEDEKEEEAEEDVEKAKHGKPGSPCKTKDGSKGTYGADGLCKALTEKDLEELTKTKFQTCMSREMKAGKTMAEAAKICKTDTKKAIEKIYTDLEESSVEKTEDKSETPAQQTDLADAERVFEDYLKQGKVVPAQKEAFIKLIASGNELKLGDDTVGVSELIKTFMESQPSSIDFDEDGVPVDDGEEKEKENGGEEEGADLSDVPAEAKDLFGKMGLSDEDIKKSWELAKTAKEEEDEDKSSLFN